MLKYEPKNVSNNVLAKYFMPAPPQHYGKPVSTITLYNLFYFK